MTSSKIYKKQAGKVTLTQSRNGYFSLAKTQKIRAIAIYKAPISSPKKDPSQRKNLRGVFRLGLCFVI